MLLRVLTGSHTQAGTVVDQGDQKGNLGLPVLPRFFFEKNSEWVPPMSPKVAKATTLDVSVA